MMGSAQGTGNRHLRIAVEPEVQVLSGGLQPFLFQSDRGTLVVQSQWPYPFDYQFPAIDRYPGLVANAVSRDGGASWTLWKPAEGQGHGPIFEGSVVQLDERTIRIFEWVASVPDADGVLTGQYWDSTDEYSTVQGPTPFRIYLPRAVGGFDDNGRPYSGVTFHRSVLRLTSGDLVATVYCWFAEDTIPSSYEAKMNRFRCVLLRSGDDGLTWSFASTIAGDTTVGEEGFDEPALIQLRHGPNAGRLICIARTGNRTSPLYQCHSDDEGATWTEAVPLPLRGVDPDLVELGNGILACTYGYRPLDDPIPAGHGNYIAFSLDHGDTWIGNTFLPIEPGSGTDRSTGYTSVREVEPGKLIVLFDIGWWQTPIRYTARRFVRVVAE
jgi:hypothetical protein